MTSPMRALGLVLVGATDAPVEAPLPGVYPHIRPETYHRWPGASNSRLSKIRQSPAHLKAYMDEPTDSAAFAMGRAVHAAVLEPEAFASDYAVSAQCGAIKKGDGQRCGNAGLVLANGEWFCGVHGKGMGSSSGRVTVLPPTDYAAVQGMRDAVMAHPKALRLLSGLGEVELSATWDDAETGAKCKARFDRYSPAIAGGAIVDIKTCRDASRVTFERSIFDYGYHRQGAFYLAGARACGLNANHFVVIAVEKAAPFAVAVYRMTEGAIDAGAEQIKPLLARYATCVETNEWPGYSDNIEDIALPTYAWGQIETEIKESVA